MRIAISGPANTGKTTLLKSFLHTWDGYETPEKTYRNILKDEDLEHSKKTTADTQWKILNSMVDSIQSYDKDSKVIFDRCPLDNIVYTLWAHENGVDGFDKEFVDKCINIAKESFKSLDIIFLLTYDPAIILEDNGERVIDKTYIYETDNIFKSLHEQYKQNYDADIFFPHNDSPGVIDLPVNQQQRIDIISEYIDPSGDIYGDEHSLFNPDKLDELEDLVKQQKNALAAEEADKELFEKFGLGGADQVPPRISDF